MAYLLGYDIGSSSIKASLIDSNNGKLLARASSPQEELTIQSPYSGWAEQHPEIWWEHVKLSTAQILSKVNISPAKIKAIGLSYQMHGLVLVNKEKKVLRPAIIWCDSRAVDIGQRAFLELGEKKCLSTLLNSPGNFTASKLKWVMENEPQIYSKTYKAMLPGDFIAMKMTDIINTTPSGLSEGIMWNFQENKLAKMLLDYYGIPEEIIPDIVPTFAIQGELTSQAAQELGLKRGTKVSYRAGDQPNNAFSLNVLQPGEAATTAGTSGVIFGITNQLVYDYQSRVNTFVHVNHQNSNPRYAVLLCLNGCGILYSWLKNKILSLNSDTITYQQMDALSAQAPPGATGLLVFPFGNGSERTLENRNIGATFQQLDFNIHELKHLLRASQEGIIFALNYGFEIMKNIGLNISTIKAGRVNQFSSTLFQKMFSTVTGTQLELFNTDGSEGAARGAGVGAKIYQTFEEAFVGLKRESIVYPDPKLQKVYQEIYHHWLSSLKNKLQQN
ncbi:MAG: FGGY family carbohydrate kinase [Atribacterota bacterium]|nr:FGGY family carbohydrate kinase [Atribacterota bacterium]